MAQYDNASQQLGLNLRMTYIVEEGTECFLVFNEILDQPQLKNPQTFGTPRSVAVLLKFNYRFTL